MEPRFSEKINETQSQEEIKHQKDNLIKKNKKENTFNNELDHTHDISIENQSQMDQGQKRKRKSHRKKLPQSHLFFGIFLEEETKIDVEDNKQ